MEAWEEVGTGETDRRAFSRALSNISRVMRRAFGTVCAPLYECTDLMCRGDADGKNEGIGGSGLRGADCGDGEGGGASPFSSLGPYPLGSERQGHGGVGSLFSSLIFAALVIAGAECDIRPPPFSSLGPLLYGGGGGIDSSLIGSSTSRFMNFCRACSCG
jgi:hypothetical protein